MRQDETRFLGTPALFLGDREHEGITMCETGRHGENRVQTLENGAESMRTDGMHEQVSASITETRQRRKPLNRAH